MTKKRLLLLVALIGLMPLLTGCGGPIGQQIMEEGIKKFIETLDPSWRASWFVTKPLTEMNSLIQFFTQFAALIGFAVGLWLTLMILKGHGMSIGAKGLLLLVSVGTVALAIPIVNSIGGKLMPEEMGLAKLAEYMGWLNLSTGLAKAGTISASALFVMGIPHVNQMAQIILTIFFCITMIGVIASASPRGLILAGSWLIGPVIFPKVFWVIVTAITQSVELTGIGPIDDWKIILRNILMIGATILTMGICYTLPYVVIKTFVWAGEVFHLFPSGFQSLNNESGSEKRSRRSSSDSSTAAAFGLGFLASETREDDEEEADSADKRKKKKGKDGSDQAQDEDGSGAGSNRQKLLTGPVDDPDVVDAEATDLDGDDGGNSPRGTGPRKPSPIAPHDELTPVDETEEPVFEEEETQTDVYRTVTKILREHDEVRVVVEEEDTTINLPHLKGRLTQTDGLVIQVAEDAAEKAVIT